VTTLSGLGLWEWETEADYAAARAAGVSWIAIRATNGNGAGKAASFEAAFRTRSDVATQAGLSVVGWTQWYGPHDGVVTGDVSKYLAGCAAYTANLGLQTSGWIVDAEDRDLPGLGDALRQLRMLSKVPVYLCAPGDPKTYSVNWDWDPINASVDTVMPKIYTAMWHTDASAPGGGDASLAFRAAMAEMDAVSHNVPRFPVCDETDPARIAAWVHEAITAKVAAISFFRAGVPGDAVAIQTYGSSFKPTTTASQPTAIDTLQSTTSPQAKPQPASAPTGWAQLTTPGPDGVEPGIFTTEFLATQGTAFLMAAFGVLTSFGVLGISDDQKKSLLELIVAVIGALQIAYGVGRAVRKGMASGPQGTATTP
jgi:hypothetical protein